MQTPDSWWGRKSGVHGGVARSLGLPVWGSRAAELLFAMTLSGSNMVNIDTVRAILE
jgi:hypothetical protein